MAGRDPASEPYESRDLELGSVLKAWVGANAVVGDIKLDGPLEAVGMDPTWVLRIRSVGFEADACLFYGPVLDVSAFRPDNIDEGAFVGGAEYFADERLAEMLNDLGSAAKGGALPNWLRSIDL